MRLQDIISEEITLDELELIVRRVYIDAIKNKLFFKNLTFAPLEKDLIEEKFKPEKIKDEKELQGQLAVFLNAVTNTKVEREVKTKSGDKIDILIDDNYVLELKVPSGKDSLRSLSAQIEEYMEEFPLLAVVIADKSDLVSDKDDREFYDDKIEPGLTQKIREYADKYKMKYGIKTLIFSVKKRKKKK